MATKKPMKKPVKRVRRFQEGGEAADKMAGLAMSNKDAPMGFFERLRMGNIDQEGSEAYNRLGAGRAKMDRVMRRDEANEADAMRMVDSSRQNQAYGKSEADVMDAMRQSDMMQRGRIAGEVVDSADRYKDYTPIAKPLAAAQNAALLAKKTPAAKTSKPATGSGGGRGAAVGEEAAYRASRAAPAPAAAPSTREERVARVDQAFQPPSAENTQKGLEAGTLGAGAAGLGLLTGALYKGRKMYKARQAAKEASRVGAEKRAILKKQAEEAIDTNLLDEFQGLASAAAKKSKKKGGMVKKMAHGGSVKSPVSTASKRGDGIALRGKTRGKIY